MTCRIALALTGLGCQMIGSCALPISPTNSPKQSMSLVVPQSRPDVSVSPAILKLAQPWNEAPDPGFQPATVSLTWNPASLLVEAELTDEEVMNLATADNQELWMLGDVFEIFLQIEGRRDYVELHVAPNNRRMHLHKPAADARPSPEADPLAFHQMLIDPIGFTATARPTPTGWRVSAAIPATILGIKEFTPGLELRASFCRYDAASGRPPILSTTAAHPVISFHRPSEWTVLKLQD